MSEIVVVVAGPLENWAGQLDSALERRPDRLVADLGECAWIDAAAIVVLLRTHGRMLRANGTFVLRRLPARVRRTLRLARVDLVLNVEESDPPAVPDPAVPDPGMLADAR